MSSSTQLPEKKDLFDPDTAFLELPIVRITITLILLLASLSFTLIVYYDPRPVVLTSEGFNRAASYLKVPLGLLTVSIPLLALLAANHRSAQTKQQMELTRRQIERTDKQIKLTSDQNNFANYYKHIEVFEKFCKDRFETPEKFVFKNMRALHNFLFPNARNGDFKADPNVVNAFNKAAIDYFSAAEGLKNSETKDKSIFDLFKNDEHLELLFGISRTTQAEGPKFKYTEYFHEYTFIIPVGTYTGFLQFLHEPFYTIDELLKFDTTYNTPHDVSIATQFWFGDWTNDQVLGPMTLDIRDGYATVSGTLELIEDQDQAA